MGDKWFFRRNCKLFEQKLCLVAGQGFQDFCNSGLSKTSLFRIEFSHSPALGVDNRVGDDRAHGLQLLVAIRQVVKVELEADPVHLRLALLAGVELVQLPHQLLPVAVVHEVILEHRLPHRQAVPEVFM